MEYSGVASLRFRTQSSQADATIWHAELSVPHFSDRRQALARDLVAIVEFTGDSLSLRKVEGGMAGGRFKAAGQFSFPDNQRPIGILHFDADQFEASGLISLIAPETSSAVSGNVSYRGRATLGREIVLSGSSRIRDAMIYSLPVQDVRSNLRFTLANSGSVREVSAENARGTALGGTLDADFKLRAKTRYEAELRIDIHDGKIDQLSRSLGFEHIIGTGRFDANARLETSELLELSALQGPVHLKFESGDAQSIPVLADLGRLVPAAQFASADISGGSLDAQVKQGQLNVQAMMLSSDAFWLLADGRASLLQGRLDIHGILQTGGGMDQQIAQYSSQRLLTAVLPQQVFLAQCNDLIRNRSLYFHIGGTAEKPVIQPKAGGYA